METKEYTAAEYRKFIAELLEGISDLRFLKQIYSLIAIQRKRTGA